jgi:hypothetical protein
VKSTRQPSDLTVVIVLKSVEMDNNGRVRAAKSKLLDLRPPASVEGLLQFVRDVPDHYSVEEQRLLSESNSGSRLSRAIVMCEKYKPNDSAMSVDGRSTIAHGEAVKNLNETKVTKYTDCLSHAACQERWRVYSTCWARDVHQLDSNVVRNLHTDRVLESLCQLERQSLERCIGGIVTNTAQLSEASQVF